MVLGFLVSCHWQGKHYCWLIFVFGTLVCDFKKLSFSLCPHPGTVYHGGDMWSLQAHTTASKSLSEFVRISIKCLLNIPDWIKNCGLEIKLAESQNHCLGVVAVTSLHHHRSFHSWEPFPLSLKSRSFYPRSCSILSSSLFY